MSALLSALRCRLGYHHYAFIGFRWVENFPGCKSGHDSVCVRCGKEYWAGPRA